MFHFLALFSSLFPQWWRYFQYDLPSYGNFIEVILKKFFPYTASFQIIFYCFYKMFCKMTYGSCSFQLIFSWFTFLCWYFSIISQTLISLIILYRMEYKHHVYVAQRFWTFFGSSYWRNVRHFYRLENNIRVGWKK